MQTGIKETETTNSTAATGAVRVFTFPDSVTIQTIEALIEELRELHLTPGETLRLDMVQTEIITTPGIQLILALAHTLEQNGGALVIANTREECSQSFGALGLASRLTQWAA